MTTGTCTRAEWTFLTCTVEERACASAAAAAAAALVSHGPAAFLQRGLSITSLLSMELMFLQGSSSRGDGQTAELLLPRVNGAGHRVVVHGVWSPAVAPHTLGAVVSGHSQVLKETIQDRRDR